MSPIGAPNKPGESSLLASLPPQAQQQAINLTDQQIQHMYMLNSHSQLNPQQQHIMRAAIEQMQLRHQRQRAGATAPVTAVSRPPLSTAPPAQTAPTQIPKPQMSVQQPQAQQQLLQQQQQQQQQHQQQQSQHQQQQQQRQSAPSSASPTLQKKMKKETEDQKSIPRPQSQAEVSRPAQVQSNLGHFSQSLPTAPKPPARPQSQDQTRSQVLVTGPPQAVQGAGNELAQRQQHVFEQLVHIYKEDQKNPDVRQPVDMPPQERETMKTNLMNPQIKGLIRRTDQLLPMFMLLGGDISSARELIRQVS
jgi:hypothetical protein